MSKSLAQKKSQRKKRGEKSYSRVRVKDYQQSRAPHTANAPRPRTPCRMLIRNASTEVVAWEVGPWKRDGDTERTTLDVKFACGCTAHREAIVAYEPGERQRLMDRAVRGDAIFESLRVRHTEILQNMLRLAQVEFTTTLPPHTGHSAR